MPPISSSMRLGASIEVIEPIVPPGGTRPGT
jgi:hypothetical protein